jgi:DNA-binding NarL/FixJ family response regulator
MALSVVLVDDHAVVRAGICRLIESTGEFEVVAEAADGRAAVEAVQRTKPAIAVMDIWLPKLSGIDATRQIRQTVPATKVVILSQHERPDIVESALREGASGYVHKGGAPDDLLAALRWVHQGKCFLSPEIAGSIVGAVSRPPQERSQPVSRLSSREREVLQLIADGLSSKEVATELGVSTRTAETHRFSLMNKLGIHKVAGLVRFAVREGLIAP